MTADEFLAWREHQEQRYELLNGIPVAMAGARRGHDQIVLNALVLLGTQLGHGQCRPFTSDTAVRISSQQIRCADAGVDCGIFRAESLEADAPRLLLEVLSDSTPAFDLVEKLEEYKTVSSLRHIVLIDTDEPKINHWSRADDSLWTYRPIDGLEAALELPDLGLTLPLRALYAGLTFRPMPRLVMDGA
jgi:Uma2 family endonuclease